MNRNFQFVEIGNRVINMAHIVMVEKGPAEDSQVDVHLSDGRVIALTGEHAKDARKFFAAPEQQVAKETN